MIVEDEHIIAMSIESTLEDYKYEIAGTFHNAEDALLEIEQNKPDLILMDIILEGEMLGTEAAAIIREKYNLPVIFLTSHADEETMSKAKASGPFGYILKPYEDVELQAAIEVALLKHHKQQELQEINSRYISLFDDSPIALAEENLSELKKFIDQIRSKHSLRLEVLFRDNDDIFKECISKIKVIEVNKNLLELFEVNTIDDYKENLCHSYSPESLASFIQGLESLERGDRTFEFSTLRKKKSGSVIHTVIKVSLSPDYEQDWEKVLLSFIDITNYVQLDQKLKKSEVKYKKLFEESNDAIIIHNFAGDIIDVNQKAISLLGYTKEELLKKMIFDFRPHGFFPEIDLMKIEILQDTSFCFDSKFLTKSESILDVSISAKVIDFSEQIMQGIIRDITPLKQEEEKRKELIRQLKLANKELKDFTFAFSHDLKTPVRAIHTLTNWIAMDYKEKFDEEGKENIALILDRTKRLYELLEGIHQYSSIGLTTFPKTWIEIQTLVQDVVMKLKIPDSFSIEIDDHLPAIYFEKTRLFQVFFHLIENSIAYCDKDEGFVKISGYFKNDQFFAVIIDNGPGIDKKYHKKIFQMFQTLEAKDSFERIGVGLPVVKKIIEASGGTIFINPDVTSGTEIHISFHTFKKK